MPGGQGMSDDIISRAAALDGLSKLRMIDTYKIDVYEMLKQLPSAQPDRKLIDDYMWKIKQNISPHTTAEGVIAIKYYLEQIYEQIYGKGEKPKWMT
jgi:hypothetical protein